MVSRSDEITNNQSIYSIIKVSSLFVNKCGAMRSGPPIPVASRKIDMVDPKSRTTIRHNRGLEGSRLYLFHIGRKYVLTLVEHVLFRKIFTVGALLLVAAPGCGEDAGGSNSPSENNCVPQYECAGVSDSCSSLANDDCEKQLVLGPRENDPLSC